MKMTHGEKGKENLNKKSVPDSGTLGDFKCAARPIFSLQHIYF